MTTPSGPRSAKVVLTAQTAQYTKGMRDAASATEKMATATIASLNKVAAAWDRVAVAQARAGSAVPVAPVVPRGPTGGGTSTSTRGGGWAGFSEQQMYRADNAMQAQARREQALVSDLERRRVRAEERVADANRASLSKASQLEQARLTIVEKRAAAERAAAAAAQANIATEVAKAKHGAIAGQAITSGGNPAELRRLSHEQSQAARDVTSAQREAAKASEFSADSAERAAMAQARVGALETHAANEARALAGRRAEAYNSISQGATRMGAVLVGAFGLAAYAAVKWEDEFTAIARISQKQLDATGMSAATLEKQLRSLARTSPASHSQIADIATQSAQLGVAPTNLAKFSKAIIELGTTTDISASQAATQLAKLINVTGDSTDSIDRIGSSLVELSNAGASTVPQIIAIAQRFAGAAQIVRLTTPEILGISSALASTGLQAEVAGSAMQRIFFKIYQGAYQGGDALRGFAAATHLSTQAFRDLYADNSGSTSGPVKVLLKIVKAMHDTSAAGGDVSAMLDKMGIRNVRDIRTLTAMSAAFAELSDDIDLATKAYEANTALEDAYNKQRASTLNQLRTAKNRIVDDAITLGATVLPALASIGDAVADIADAFDRLPNFVKKGIATIGLFGGVGLLAVAMMAKFVGTITGVGRAFGILRGTAGAAAAAQAAQTQATIASAQATAAAATANAALARSQVAVAGTGEAAAVATAEAAAAAEAQAVAANQAALAAGRLATANRANTGGGLAGMAGSIGKVSGYATIAIALMYGMSKATDALNKSAYGAVDIAAYADSLKLFADQGVLTGVAADELGKKMANLKQNFDADKGDGGWREKLRDFGNTTAGFMSLGKLDTGSFYDDLLSMAGSKNDFRDAEQSIGDLDKALEQMVNSGSAKQASVLWVQIRDAWVASGRALDDLPTAFARYTAAASGPLGITQKMADAQEDLNQKQIEFRQSLEDSRDAFLGGAEAQDKYASDLLELQELAKKSTVSIDDLRDAVSKAVETSFAAGDANDKYQSSLNDLRTALKGTKDDAKDAADAMDIMSSAIDKALDIAFDPQDVIDKFNAKIDEIKDALSGPDDSVRDALIAKINVITEGDLDKNDPELQKVVEALRKQLADSLKSSPGNLSLDGDSPAARANRADVEDLIRTQADLYKLTADVNDPGPAFRARRKALENALVEIGYSQADIAKALNQFDSLPETLAEAKKLNPADKSGAKGTGPRSTKLTGNTDDAIANRNAIRDLVNASAEKIEQDVRFGKSQAQVTQAVKDQRAELRKQLLEMGFASKDIEPFLRALDDIPAAYKNATTSSESARKAILDQRAAVRGLAQDAADLIANYNKDGDKSAAQVAANTAKVIADFQRQTDALKLGPNAQLKEMRKYLADVGDITITGTTNMDLSGLNKGLNQAEATRNNWNGYFNKNPITLRVTTTGLENTGVFSRIVAAAQPPAAAPKKKAGGGWMSGPGGPDGDQIPAMLSDGEFVVKASAAGRHAGLLEAINRGGPLDRYASGGWAHSPGHHASAGVFDRARYATARHVPAAAPQIHVNVPEGITAKDLAALISSRPVVVTLDGREIARALGDGANARNRTR